MFKIFGEKYFEIYLERFVWKYIFLKIKKINLHLNL
jgi:hypothetical protein